MNLFKYCKNPKCTGATHPHQPYYEICSWCCGELGFKISDQIKLPYTTQKANGLWVLSQLAEVIASGVIPVTPIVTVFKSEEAIDAWVKKYYVTGDKLPVTSVFARPCPKTPRHGFVDSRVVETLEDLKKVLAETLEADPDGELMITSPINASLNAVITPSLLTIGAGHDGATSGKNTVSFPLPGKLEGLDEQILRVAGVKEGEDPYLEAVQKTNGGWFLTQLRSGPKLEGSSRDVIPEKVEVKAILRPKGMDLLLWEQLILKAKDAPDGIVVENLGGSPVDHYSVHARAAGIPLVTSREIKEGEILEKTEVAKLDPLKVLEGIAVGDFIGIEFQKGTYTSENSPISPGKLCNLMIASFHGGIGAGGDMSWWFGFGAALMIRFGALALKGEARHIHHKEKASRNATYYAGRNFTIGRHRASLGRLVHILRYGQFQGTAIGGPKWAQCGKAIGDMLDAVGDLAANKDEASLSKLITTFNVALNQAHNGGWWLNKFTQQQNFAYLQRGQLIAILPLAETINAAVEAYNHLPGEVFTARVKKWGSWGKVKYLRPAITKAEFEFNPALPGISFNVEDRILRDKRRPIVLDGKALMPKLEAIFKGQLELIPSPEGLKVVAKKKINKGDIKHGVLPLILWEEEDLTPQALPAQK